jgi:hypothetical protein
MGEAMFRIPDHVLVSHLAGEAVLLDMDSRNYYRLNATAAAIWKALERGQSLHAIAEELVSKFEVDERTAREALQEQVDELLRLRLVEEDAPLAGGASE